MSPGTTPLHRGSPGLYSVRMAKKLRRGTGGTSGQWRGQPKGKPAKGKAPDMVDIPVDATRATVPIPGLKAGKRKT